MILSKKTYKNIDLVKIQNLVQLKLNLMLATILCSA